MRMQLKAVICRAVCVSGCLGALCVFVCVCVPVWDRCSASLLPKPAHRDKSHVHLGAMVSKEGSLCPGVRGVQQPAFTSLTYIIQIILFFFFYIVAVRIRLEFNCSCLKVSLKTQAMVRRVVVVGQ